VRSIKGIQTGLKEKLGIDEISQKIYLGYPTTVFENKEDIQYAIITEISNWLTVPYAAIEVCGSGKTGISFFEDRKFIPGESDLDIAVVNLHLFTHYSEIAYRVTNGYTDLTKFLLYNGERTDKLFLKGMYKGYCNPYFMPKCNERSELLNFFDSLSNKYTSLFKRINASIYATEFFFIEKQIPCIDKYIENPIKYDKISGTV